MRGVERKQSALIAENARAGRPETHVACFRVPPLTPALSLKGRGGATTVFLALAALFVSLCVSLAHADTPAPTTSPTTAPTTAPASISISDRWYRMYLGESLVGWARMQETKQPAASGRVEDDKFTTSSQVRFTVDRGGFSMKLGVDVTYTESGDGRPLHSVTKKKLGEYAIDEEMFFRGKRGESGVDLFTKQLGTTRHDKLPGVVNKEAKAAGGEAWVSSREAERIVREAMQRGDERIAVWTLDPAAGAQVIQTVTVYEGEAELTIKGKRLKTSVYRQKIEGRPGSAAKIYVDAATKTDAVQIEQTVAPGMDVRLVLSDASAADAKIDKIETMQASLVKAGSSIKDARKLRRGVYVMETSGVANALEKEKGGAGFVLMTAGWQRATAVQGGAEVGAKPEAGARTFRVEVDLDKPVWISEGDADWPSDENRNANAMMDFEDAEVAALVARARKDFQSDAVLAKARVLRDFVFRHISKKDYTIGFGSASEVARTKRGDCTEHGVLLAAMLRGADVQSRVVTGLVYAPEVEGEKDVFVFHMWTQAWVEDAAKTADGKRRGHWVDFDATLPDGALFDAAHVAVGVSTLSAQTPIEQDMAYKLASMGRVKMKVIEPAE